MPNTYTLIASNTVGSGGAASVTFSSIASTYTDLIVKYSARVTNNTNAIEVNLSFNGVTTNLSSRGLYSSGTGTGSQTQATVITGLASANSDTSNTFGSAEIYIPNYTASTNKSVSSDATSENNAAANYSYLTAGLWSSTSAITQITLTPYATNFVQYSTFYLYGIKNS